MFANGPSLLSLSGTLVYLAVAAVSALAFAQAGKGKRPAEERRLWMVACTCFVLLAIVRICNAEEVFRDMLRSVLVQDGAYEERRDIQGPIVAVAILTSFAVLFALSGVWRRTRSRLEFSLKWARMGLAAMAALVALRLISFHQLDALLYRGPHLNWIVDLGSSLVVAAAALRYARLLGLGTR